MSDDFETVEPGTINELVGKTMLLKAALDLIDLYEEKGLYAKESQEQRELVEQLRLEL